MSRFPDNGFHPRRLYRDTENGMCFGVCAGVADYFGFNLFAARCLTLLAFIFMPVTILISLGAAFLLRRKPPELHGTPEEEELKRTVRRDPHHVFHALRHRFRQMDARLARMERYITSPRYRLDKEFEDLSN